MHCKTINTGQGMTIVCGSKPKKQPCDCGAEAFFQCDYLLETRKGGSDCLSKQTCDKWLCMKCANRVAYNTDYCPTHFELWEKRKEAANV